jgi:hypothetical protein
MSMIFTSLCWFSDPVYSFRLQLFFPTCFEDHWIVFVVDIKDRKYVMLDSKHNEDDSFQEAARSRMVSVCVKLPFYEHCLLYIELFFFTFVFAYRDLRLSTFGKNLFTLTWGSHIMSLPIPQFLATPHRISELLFLPSRCVFLLFYKYILRHVFDMLRLDLVILLGSCPFLCCLPPFILFVWCV